MLLNSRNINILKKAFPHLDEQRKKPINIILKLTELTECINEFSHSNGLESCSTSSTPINTEELLKDIRSECPKQYRDMIDFILNFSKTKDFYNTYKTINNLTHTNIDTHNTDSNHTSSNIEFFKNQLSKEQLERINELSHIINNSSASNQV